MADELTPITRLEGIIAGQDITPITRLEHFLKQYAGGGGGSGGGGGVYIVDCTMSGSVVTSTKTAGEIFEAIESKTVVFKVTAGGMAAYMQLIYASNDDGYAFVVNKNKRFAGMVFSADSADDYPAANPK